MDGGHAHLREWSIGFSNGVAADGEELADGYVARAGRVVLVDCRPEAVGGREVTAMHSGPIPIPEVGYDLTDGQMLAMEVKAVGLNALVEGVHERFLTSVTEGIVGRKNSTGVGMFDRFLQTQA